MDKRRYSRQIVFEKIGPAAQEKNFAARAVIIGIGALGTVIANNLCRSGVGRLRLIDGGRVERSNLQRQILFDEEDPAAVLNMASNIIASLESAEAIKIITCSPDINRRIFVLDLWNYTAEYLNIEKDPDCPVCGNRREKNAALSAKIGT